MKDLKNDMLKYQKKNKKKYFIIKPEASSQGKGIQIIRWFNEIDTSIEYKILAQKYLDKPFLIDELKFDLRIYVLVTSVDPLRIWVHKDGFLRFCTHKYAEPTNQNIQDLCMHLTNYAINKNSKHFVHNNDNN